MALRICESVQSGEVMERIRTNKLNTPDNCNLFIHLSPLNFVIFMLLHREGEREKGEGGKGS